MAATRETLSAHAARVETGRRGLAAPVTLSRVGSGTWMAAGVAAVLAAIAFVAGGGLALDTAVPVEMGLTLGGAALACAALAAPRTEPIHGGAALGLLFALAGFTCASVIWSVAPNASWIEGSRTLAYACTFLAGIALVRLVPARWESLLVGVMVAGLAVSAYALATRIFPGALSANEVYARLRAPFDYWNAIGLTAALAVPPFLWLGSRREGHGTVAALAYPAVMLLLVALMLAYSRGALLALGLGLAFYFATVPLRLRSLTVLVVGGVGAAAVVGWAFAKPALSVDHVVLSARIHFGHLLGLLLVGVALLVYAAGLAIGFAAARWPPPAALRRRAGVAVLVALALVPFVGAVALSASSRGLGGTISHDWRALTDPHATTPPNDPSRLTAVGSVRARYWNDGLKIGRDHPLVGVGAGGYPTARTFYRQDTLEVQHAHGYVIQTFADLGVVGLVLSLAFCAAWARAAIVTAGGRRAATTPERIGLLTMISCVIVFTFHSLIDWTFFIPGNAAVALLLGGWVAGRGPLGRRAAAAPERRERIRMAGLTQRPVRAVAAAAVLALALCFAWSEWQPLRSQQAESTAFAALAAKNYPAARAAADTAAARDPLSVGPLLDLATVETAAGRPAAARAALVRAVHLTPSDATTWEQLAAFDDQQLGNRTLALSELGAALYLDPQSHAAISTYLDTLRGGSPAAAPTPPPAPAAQPATQPAGTT